MPLIILDSPPICTSSSVEIMRFRSNALVLLVVVMIGCDVTESEPADLSSAATDVRMDIGGIVSLSQQCQSIVSKIELRVEGEPVGTSSVDRDGVAVFSSVQVPIGAVLTEASVFSNRDALVFSATGVSVVERDGFTLNLRPEPVKPVLEVCLPHNRQQFVIVNRGIGSLNWRLIPQGDAAACVTDDPPCLDFNQGAEGMTTDSVVVDFRVQTSTPRSFDVLVWSPEGDIGVTIDPVFSKHEFWSIERGER